MEAPEDIILEWEQRKKSRTGGGAPCESRKTVFCVPSPVANDSCHDQARAWLLGDIAEKEKSSSVAGVPVISYSFCRLCHASHNSFSRASVSWQATSTLAKEIRDTPADLSSVALNIAWKRSSLAEWVYKAMHEMSKKPALWIHAWRHLMTASEEERKVNVDRAKRAFTDFAPHSPWHCPRDSSNMRGQCGTRRRPPRDRAYA